MRALHLLATVALAVPATGCMLVFEDPDHATDDDIVVPPIDPPVAKLETQRLVPILCSGDVCSFNEVPLDDLGADARILFLARPIAGGIALREIQLIAGELPIAADQPTLRVWTPSGVELDQVRLSELVLVGPGASFELGVDPPVDLRVAGSVQLSFRFRALDTLHPL